MGEGVWGLGGIGLLRLILLPNLQSLRSEEVEEDRHTAEHVQAMQAGHHEVGGVEVVRLGEVVVVELRGVLKGFDHQKPQRAEKGEADEPLSLAQVAEA